MSRILKIAERFERILKKAEEGPSVSYERDSKLVALDKAGLSNVGNQTRVVAILKKAGLKNFFNLLAGSGQFDYTFEANGKSVSGEDLYLKFNDDVSEETKNQVTQTIQKAFAVLITEQLKITASKPSSNKVSIKWVLGDQFWKNFN